MGHLDLGRMECRVLADSGSGENPNTRGTASFVIGGATVTPLANQA